MIRDERRGEDSASLGGGGATRVLDHAGDRFYKRGAEIALAMRKSHL